MRGICIYVKLPEFEKEWLRQKYGWPVKFPMWSAENAFLIARARTPRRSGACTAGEEREVEEEDKGVAVVLPDNRIKPPEYYHCFSREDLVRLAQLIDMEFRMAMWTELSPLFTSDEKIGDGITAWCKRNGISIDNEESVRRRLYRMRELYRRAGTVIGRFNQRRK